MMSARPLVAAGPLVLAAALTLTACGQPEPAQAPAAPPPAAAGSAESPLAPAVASPEAATPGVPADSDRGPAPAPAPNAPPAAGEQGGEGDWREVATAADASALGRLDQAWRLGRAEADDRGFGDELEALGALVDPDAGQSGRLQPPPGAYACRTVKLGTRSEGQGLAYVAYPRFRCGVELTAGGDLILTKTTGSHARAACSIPTAATGWSSSAPRPGATKRTIPATARPANATRSAPSNGSGPTAGGWSFRGRNRKPSSRSSN